MSITIAAGRVIADTELPAAAALADATANPTVPSVGAAGLVWNGATWDREEGNKGIVQIMNIAAQTTNQESAAQVNRTCIAANFRIDISVSPAGEFLLPMLRMGTCVCLVGPAAGLSGVGSHCWSVGPGLPSDSTFQATVDAGFKLGRTNGRIPRDWTVFMDHSAAGAWTYTVYVEMITR